MGRIARAQKGPANFNKQSGPGAGGQSQSGLTGLVGVSKRSKINGTNSSKAVAKLKRKQHLARAQSSTPGNLVSSNKPELVPDTNKKSEAAEKLTQLKQSLKGATHMTKVERRKMKATALREKLSEDAEQVKADFETKKREKRPVVGDVNPLLQSLDLIAEEISKDDLTKSASDKLTADSIPKVKKKPMKQKHRKKQFHNDLQLFTQLRNNANKAKMEK